MGGWEGRRVSLGRDKLAGEMFMKAVSKQTVWVAGIAIQTQSILSCNRNPF